MHDVTRVLNAIDEGDPQAADRLLPLVYDELRKLAAVRLARENPGQTLQATALVHEVYLRLVGEDGAAPKWENKAHFFGAAAEAMRRILVDAARRKGRLRRGGDLERCDLEIDNVGTASQCDHILAVNEALAKLALEQPVKAELVKLRYFAGLTLAEAATVLGISTATADRYWRYARAWLSQQIRDDGE